MHKPYRIQSLIITFKTFVSYQIPNHSKLQAISCNQQREFRICRTFSGATRMRTTVFGRIRRFSPFSTKTATEAAAAERTDLGISRLAFENRRCSSSTSIRHAGPHLRCCDIHI